jgi:hypothetical protein
MDAQELRKEWKQVDPNRQCKQMIGFMLTYTDEYVEHLEKLVCEQVERIEKYYKEITDIKVQHILDCDVCSEADSAELAELKAEMYCAKNCPNEKPCPTHCQKQFKPTK